MNLKNNTWAHNLTIYYIQMDDVLLNDGDRDTIDGDYIYISLMMSVDNRFKLSMQWYDGMMITYCNYN